MEQAGRGGNAYVGHVRCSVSRQHIKWLSSASTSLTSRLTLRARMLQRGGDVTLVNSSSAPDVATPDDHHFDTWRLIGKLIGNGAYTWRDTISSLYILPSVCTISHDSAK